MELIERAEESRLRFEHERSDFNNGHSLAYNETISFLIKQLKVFELKSILNQKLRNITPPL